MLQNNTIIESMDKLQKYRSGSLQTEIDSIGKRVGLGLASSK
jgi:hypothetical protein